jgi:hypothetical protein
VVLRHLAERETAGQAAGQQDSDEKSSAHVRKAREITELADGIRAYLRREPDTLTPDVAE